MKNMIQYLPFILIVLGIISISVSAFMLFKPLGFLVVGVGLFLLAYILVPKGANT
ncbi:hypothetical protein RD786_01670 [Leuconostoc citreum]|uniref:hypothetical protein n=1 Tax=Leuconostoc citreum TaxID=33964 RepID=UPI0028114D23|nr:hypothetical protein [Leuconostoc citreum]WMS78964.1 hypothetical protein RD786_01670 [Leuconostoc citreum]